MSRALDYLVRVRPEAMQPYLAFLKQAGKRLDPKTRALISMLSKVYAQTEPGLRQYLPRALAAGATPDEVLDTLLAAFPMLGLSRIIWAVDIILAMDLPEFRPDSFGQAPAWHPLTALDDLPQGVSRHHCADRAVFVHRTGDMLAVYDSRCPHQATDIPELAVDGQRLTCPRHGWVFDLGSGACVVKGKRPLRALEHRLTQGQVEVLV